MQRRIILLLLVLLVGLSVTAMAQPGQRYLVTIENLTPAQPFSPPVVVVHSRRTEVFHPGGVASPELATVAESGNPTDLVALMSADRNVMDVQVAADGPFFAPTSVSTEVVATPQAGLLTIVGMLGSTNDAFYALHEAKIVGGPPRQVFYLSAWDAGSEGNNESCDYVPGPPCSGATQRDTENAEGFIHVHSGIHGIGDLPPSMLDWNNPVARVVVQRMPN